MTLFRPSLLLTSLTSMSGLSWSRGQNSNNQGHVRKHVHVVELSTLSSGDKLLSLFFLPVCVYMSLLSGLGDCCLEYFLSLHHIYGLQNIVIYGRQRIVLTCTVMSEGVLVDTANLDIR